MNQNASVLAWMYHHLLLLDCVETLAAQGVTVKNLSF